MTGVIRPYYGPIDGITIYHGDCREILPHITGDVLVTDPPYGIDFAGQPTKWQRRAGKQAEDWDREIVPEIPAIAARFGEAFVWGGNYYALPPSRGWLCWVKPDAPPQWARSSCAGRRATRSRGTSSVPLAPQTTSASGTQTRSRCPS